MMATSGRLEHAQRGSVRADLVAESPSLLAPLDDVQALVETGLYSSATKRFGEFRHAAERHLYEEEHFLFPYVHGELEPSIQQIREEHRSLADSIDQLATALAYWEQARCVKLIAELKVKLAALHQLEARCLSAMIEAQQDR